MRRTLLNDGWEFRPKTNRFAELQGEASAEWESIVLPHDAMIGTERDPDIGPANAFFAGNVWEYRRSIDRPEGDDSCVVLEFEGVYRDAVVIVNDMAVARRANGYVRFAVGIDHVLRPGENEIRVEATAGDDSRWYSGAGIHRDVWLLESHRVHVAPTGLSIRTPEVDDDGAVVTVDVTVDNHGSTRANPTLRLEVLSADGAVVATDQAPVTAFGRASAEMHRRLFVAEPRRWALDDPHLYTCRAILLDEAGPIDDVSSTFGIRTLALDAMRGLRVNGETVKLRGACIHHDNGPLGAAAFARADERRIERLRAAGFNAVRSAHNPMSRTLLDACDRHGVLVMDESFDMWHQPKTEQDHARHFVDEWEADIEAMVRNAENHPSVVMYSIGNEIPDGSSPIGLETARALSGAVRSVDDSRYVTQAVTGLLIGGSELFDELRDSFSPDAQVDAETGVNTAAVSLGDMMRKLVTSPIVDAKTTEAFAHLDVAGYNYMDSRYEPDAALHPSRVIVGTESHPKVIDQIWATVEALPSVIGDFVWTGWDYLGEAGIGRNDHSADPDPQGFHGEYPWRAAWCGDIDMVGHRRPQSYYREIVFGLRTDPYVTVLRPEHELRPNAHHSPWGWDDVVSSWTWPGHEGETVRVDVYADADEVELLLDGESLGLQPCRAEERFRATFEVPYAPGALEAVARNGEDEIGRTSLRSASDAVRLDVVAERSRISASSGDLGYVGVALADEKGVPHVASDRVVAVTVGGAGVLQALGSGAPVSEDAFTASSCTTYDGRALAIIRPTGIGEVTVTFESDGCDPASVTIDVRHDRETDPRC